MKKEFKILKKHYGNHSAVSKILGITPEHYRRIRNGHHPGSIMLINLIKAKVKEIKTKNLLSQ